MCSSWNLRWRPNDQEARRFSPPQSSQWKERTIRENDVCLAVSEAHIVVSTRVVHKTIEPISSAKSQLQVSLHSD
jgi:hypothetical protein